MALRQVAVEDGLDTVGVADLGVDGGTGHVGHHGVAAAEGVLGVAERVVLGRGLGEPHIAAVAAEVARVERGGNILLDDDGAAGGVDEPRALLHLGDELLVEQALGRLVQRAVDGDDVALRDHLLEALDAAAPDLLLDLGRQALVVVVQQLLAVEGLEAAQHALADAADAHSADDLVLQVVLVLGHGGHVPAAAGDLLVRGHEVAHQHQDGHDDVLGHGDDVRARDLGDGDAPVGLVGGVQVDVVGADAGGDGELELLRLGEALSGEVAGVEAFLMGMTCQLGLLSKSIGEDQGRSRGGPWNLRSGDDDLGVDELLVEGRALALLVGGGHEGVAGILEPLADAQLVLSRAEKLRDLVWRMRG